LKLLILQLNSQEDGDIILRKYLIIKPELFLLKEISGAEEFLLVDHLMTQSDLKNLDLLKV
jgi:hypothetical protein